MWRVASRSRALGCNHLPIFAFSLSCTSNCERKLNPMVSILLQHFPRRRPRRGRSRWLPILSVGLFLVLATRPHAFAEDSENAVSDEMKDAIASYHKLSVSAVGQPDLALLKATAEKLSSFAQKSSQKGSYLDVGLASYFLGLMKNKGWNTEQGLPVEKLVNKAIQNWRTAKLIELEDNQWDSVAILPRSKMMVVPTGSKGAILRKKPTIINSEEVKPGYTKSFEVLARVDGVPPKDETEKTWYLTVNWNHLPAFVSATAVRLVEPDKSSEPVSNSNDAATPVEATPAVVPVPVVVAANEDARANSTSIPPEALQTLDKRVQRLADSVEALRTHLTSDDFEDSIVATIATKYLDFLYQENAKFRQEVTNAQKDAPSALKAQIAAAISDQLRPVRDELADLKGKLKGLLDASSAQKIATNVLIQAVESRSTLATTPEGTPHVGESWNWLNLVVATLVGIALGGAACGGGVYFFLAPRPSQKPAGAEEGKADGADDTEPPLEIDDRSDDLEDLRSRVAELTELAQEAKGTLASNAEITSAIKERITEIIRVFEPVLKMQEEIIRRKAEVHRQKEDAVLRRKERAQRDEEETRRLLQQEEQKREVQKLRAENFRNTIESVMADYRSVLAKQKDTDNFQNDWNAFALEKTETLNVLRVSTIGRLSAAKYWGVAIKFEDGAGPDANRCLVLIGYPVVSDSKWRIADGLNAQEEFELAFEVAVEGGGNMVSIERPAEAMWRSSETIEIKTRGKIRIPLM